jgi:beta-lactamase class A
MNVSGFPGKYGLYLEYPLGNTLVSKGINNVIRSASVIKLPIMYYGFHIEDNMDEMIEVTPDDVVDGSGVLQTLIIQPKSFSVRDLHVLMIVVSDNTATNLLIKRYGLKSLNVFMKSIGMESSKLGRIMRDEVAITKGHDNLLSAQDIVSCLRSMTNSVLFEEMMEILKGQQFQDKVPFGVSSEAFTFYNKTGELDDIDHDAGFFVYKNQLGLYVGLTEGDKASTRTLLHDFGRKIRGI